MADISDVEQALATCVTNVLYPQGPAQTSIIGAICRIYRGWPNSASLNTDLSAGIANVTISSENRSGRTTTRHLREWQITPILPSLTAEVNGRSILIGGTVSRGNVVGALVDGSTYVYRVDSSDTPDLVAANLCAIMQPTLDATAHGPIIHLPGATGITVRVVCDNSAQFEARRQEKDVSVISWCPSPAMRDSLTSAIDLSIAQLSFLSLPDDSMARVVYRNTTTSDQSQNALLYRRDLIYSIEYSTMVSAELPSMIFGAAALNGQITFG